MSRCKSCNKIIELAEFKYKHKETGEHDALCVSCRNMSFDTCMTTEHEHVWGSVTEFVGAMLKQDGCIRQEELPNFNDKQQED